MIHDLAAGIPGLDIKQFDRCAGRQMWLGAVTRDRDLAVRLGVRGTPALFLNGEQMQGVSNGAALHRALDEALARIQAEPDGRAPDKGAGVKSGATPTAH